MRRHRRHRAGPPVAGRAGRLLQGQRHRRRAEAGVDRALRRSWSRPACAAVARRTAVPVARAAQDVEADQPGDVVGLGPGGDLLGGLPSCDDPAVVEHHHPVRQRHRVEGVVGDQHRHPVERRAGAGRARRAAPSRPRRRGRPAARRAAAPAARTASARAIATRCAWPPESWRGRRRGEVADAEPVEPGARAPARPRAAGRPGCAARRRRCRARRGAGSSSCRWKTMPTSRSWVRSRAARRPPRWSPSRRTCPSSSGTTPASARSSVDLPAPLGPITATTSPGSAVRCTSTRWSGRRTTTWASTGGSSPHRSLHRLVEPALAQQRQHRDADHRAGPR